MRRSSDDSGLDRGQEINGASARVWAQQHDVKDWDKVESVRRSKSIGCVISTFRDLSTECWTCGEFSMKLWDDDDD